MGRSLGQIRGRCQGTSTPLVGPSCAFVGGISNCPNCGRESHQPSAYHLPVGSSEPGGGVPIPLCPEQSLLPPMQMTKKKKEN